MITYQFPPKASRVFTASKIFQMNLEAGEVPQYILDEEFEIVSAVAGSVYYLERISATPSIAPEIWVSSAGAIQSEIPALQIFDVLGNPVNGLGAPIVAPMSERPLEIWISNDSSGVIKAKIRGKLYQTGDLVTVGSVRLAVSITGYEISANAISGAYRSGIEADTLKQFRGA